MYANDSGVITVLMEDGSTASLGVSGEYAAKMKELDGDKYLEAPFVNGNGDIRLVDKTGETATLVNGDAPTGADMIASADWDGDGLPAVFYENTSNGKLYYVEYGGSPSALLASGSKIGTNGVVGYADYDGDGDTDLVYLGSSSTVKYYDGSNIGSTGFSSFGSNNGVGIGAPADFDGDGVPRVPYVTGSNNLGLLAHDGSKTKLDSNYGDAVKAPVAAEDVAGDSTPEVLHINKKNNNLYYAYLNGTVDPVLNANGKKIGTIAGFGVSAAASQPAPAISNFTATNPAGRELRVSFNASDQLANITVNVTGPEDFSLNESDFTESGSGPYTYTATYQVNADGNYTATLVTAADANGNDGADGQNDSVSIQTPAPTVRNVSISDAADGNGIVGDNDTIRVTAEVLNESTLVSVTANASTFGTGPITLTNQSGTYVGNFSVDAANASPDGNTSITVTATNEYDHSDTNESDTLFLDTTPPEPDPGQNRTVKEDTSVGFDADGSTDNTRITRYVWQFGDGTSATGATATHTYATPGTYNATLTVYDVENHSATSTRVINVTDVSENESLVQNVTLTDVSDANGVVGDGDTVRVTAEIHNESALASVTADASPFGAGTVTLTNQSGVYAANVTVDDAEAGPDGDTSVTVTAVNEYNHSDTDASDTLLLDTTPPNPDPGQNLTVEEDTTVSFNGGQSTDLSRITRYVWHFGDGTSATGATATHTYEDPGTYNATLTVYDVENHSATATRVINVTDVSESTDGTTDTTETTETTTKVISVDQTAGDDTRSPMRIKLTSKNSVVEGHVVNAKIGRTVSIPFELVTKQSGSAALTELEFDTQRAGNFTVRKRPRAEASERVPSLSGNRDVRPLQYVTVGHSISSDDVSEVSLTFTVPKTALNGTSPAALRVYRYDGGWTAHDATIINETSDSYRIRTWVPGLSTYAVGIVQPNLTVASASLGSQTISVGDTGKVTAVVENNGARAGTTTVAIRVDGAVVARQTVSVPAGERERLTVQHTFENAGRYTVAVEDTSAGTLRVEPEQSESTTSSTSAALVPFLAIVLLFGAYIYTSISDRPRGVPGPFGP